MVIAVRTERGPSGLEVVKVADDDAGRARLVREAEVLGRAAGPGVVEVVDRSESVLHLRHRGTPLSRLGPIAPDHAAAVVRAVAATVDTLHDRGIAHGRIDADHVLLSERGRPFLCGFGEATDGDESAMAGDVAGLGRLLDTLLDTSHAVLWSPAHRGARAATRRKRAMKGFRTAAAAATRDEPGRRPSVRQFATALDDALPGLALPTPPGAETDLGSDDFGAIPHDVDPTGRLEWSDLDLSLFAADDDVPHEETGELPITANPYAELADLSDDESDHDEPDGGGDGVVTADTDTDPGTVGDRDRRTGSVHAAPRQRASAGVLGSVEIRPGRAGTAPDHGPSRRVLVAVGVAVLAVGVVAGSVVARAIDPFGAGTASASGSATTEVPTASEADEQSPDRTPPPLPDGCEDVEVPGPDTDGDGCPEQITLDDRIAVVGGVEVELGGDGDLVALSDADCDGVATPVLLRPSSGEVFAFEKWNLSEPTEVPASATIDGAESITVADEPCAPAVVTDADGTAHAVTGSR